MTQQQQQQQQQLLLLRRGWQTQLVWSLRM